MIVAIGKTIASNKNLIFVPKRGNNIFDRSDTMDTKMVYINSINGDPIKSVRFGNLYDIKSLNIIGTPEPLYSANTIKTLFDLGQISHEYDEEHPVCADWLLSDLVQNDNGCVPEVLDTVRENNPTLYTHKTLCAFMNLAQTVDAIQWLLSKGAGLYEVQGFGNPIQWHSMNVNPNDTSIINYLMNYYKVSSKEELLNLVTIYKE